MTRMILVIFFLALITLALLPNPENPNSSEWDNLPRYENSEPSLLVRALATLGIRIPREFLPGLGLISIPVLLSWVKNLFSSRE